MERDLINHEYLNELLSVAQDQEENDLVSQLFERLINNRNQFLKTTDELLSDDQKLAFELHKLKNQFANLGCVAAQHMLEDMYQLAKQHRVEEVRQLLKEFNSLSETTLQQLQSEITH